MRATLSLAAGLLAFPGLASALPPNGPAAASCPQYKLSPELYMGQYRKLTTAADVDRCLDSIAELEKWKLAWRVDSDYDNGVLEYTGILPGYKGQLGLRLSQDLMRESEAATLRVHWKTLQRRGFVEIASNRFRDCVDSVAKPDRTYNLSEFRDRLLFARELGAVVALEIADEEFAIGALKPDIEQGKLSRQEVQAVNRRIDQLDGRREAFKSFEGMLLGAASSLPAALSRVEEKLRALVLEKMRERKLGARVSLGPLAEAGAISFDGGRSR